MHPRIERWVAAASLQLGADNPNAFDASRPTTASSPAPSDPISKRLAATESNTPAAHGRWAITVATNHHVDVLNAGVQAARFHAGHLDPSRTAAIGGREHALPHLSVQETVPRTSSSSSSISGQFIWVGAVSATMTAPLIIRAAGVQMRCLPRD